MAKVHIAQTSSGYLPTLVWGEGADMNREAYGMAYENLATAERIGRGWAEEQDAEYVPFAPVDADAIHRRALLVRRLREEEGLDLAAAITRARTMLDAA